MKTPRFSRRTAWDLAPNDLAGELDAARQMQRSVIDLTESNPTRVGLGGGAELVALLGDARGALYEPHPLGHASARGAVAGYYRERGVAVDPERVVLSASTSESYAWAFKLLLDPGDSVLVPAPSYPLFGFLAELEEVRIATYPLMRNNGWMVDLGALRAAIDATTRAIVVVHPNNPTGSFVRRDEALALEELAREHGLAIVADEVFGDYAHGTLDAALPTFAGRTGCLTLVLSGLSKVVALPQLKLGWIAVSGPEAVARDALARLEVIADTFLSVGTPVQLALPAILAARAEVQERIRARVRTNLATLDSLLERVPAQRLAADAGWYAIVEVPALPDGDDWEILLLREEGIVVHPGYFFDIEGNATLVLSLLPEGDVFADAVGRIARRIRAVGRTL